MKLIAITGEKRTGKSTLTYGIMDELRKKSFVIDGFLSLSVVEDNELIGFDLLILSTNQTTPLARKKLNSTIKTAQFGFYSEVFDYQNRIIQSINKSNKIIFLDEIGILELKDFGWHNLVLDIKLKEYKGVILVIRKSCFFELTKKYNLKYDLLVDLDSTDISLEMLKRRVINFLS